MPAKKGWTKALSHIYSAQCRHTKENIFKKYRDWICKKKSTLLFVSFMQTNSIYPKIQYSYSPCTWKIYFYTLTHTLTPLSQFILIYDRTRSKRIFCKCSKMYSLIFECKSWQNRKNFSQWRDVAILFLQ